MRKIIITLLTFLLTIPAHAETIDFSELVEINGLIYQKITNKLNIAKFKDKGTCRIRIISKGMVIGLFTMQKDSQMQFSLSEAERKMDKLRDFPGLVSKREKELSKTGNTLSKKTFSFYLTHMGAVTRRRGLLIILSMSKFVFYPA